MSNKDWHELEKGFSITYINGLFVRGYAIKVDGDLSPNIKLKHCKRKTKTEELLDGYNYIVAINASFYNKKNLEIVGGIVENFENEQSINSNQQLLCFDNKGNLGFELSKETKTAVQSNPILVRDGKNMCGGSDTFGWRPRAAIGQTSKRDIIMTVFESVFGDTIWGISKHALANVMLELGAINAMNLDGGGNECLMYRGKIVNSIGSKRKTRYTCGVLYI